MTTTIFIALNIFLVAITFGTGVPVWLKTWGVTMSFIAFWLFYAAWQIHFAPGAVEAIGSGQAPIALVWPATVAYFANVAVHMYPHIRATRSKQPTS